MSWWKTRSSSPSEILGFITRSPLGAELVAESAELVTQAKLEVRACLQTELDRLTTRSQNGHRGTPSAAFVLQVPKSKLIYLEGLELGLTAALVFHELVHATDSDYIESHQRESELWRALELRSVEILKQSSKRTQRTISELGSDDLPESHLEEMLKLKSQWQHFADQRLFAAERKAHDKLQAWIHEMDFKFSGFKSYLTTARAQGYCLDRPMSDMEIVRAYGLDSLSTAA